MKIQQRARSMCEQNHDLSSSDDARSLLYHIYTLYLFTCNNLKDIVLLGYLFGVIGALCSHVFEFGANIGLCEIIQKTPAMLFWSWTNLLLFNLHNQRHPGAILEDGINKAWRPLPAKRLTAAEATWLMYAMYPVVIFSSAYLGGFIPCLLEAFLCLCYNEWRGAESPIPKNLLTAAGFACFLSGPLEIVVGGGSLLKFPKALQWVTIIGLIIFLTAHTQDFRDQEGDKLRKRRTIPLVIGDTYARWVVVVAVIFFSWLALLFWKLNIGGFLLPMSTGILLIYNLMWKRTVDDDVWTWKLWPIWMSSFFLLPLVKMCSAHSNL